MAQILEVVMIVSFGASWPMNVMKSWKARTTKGKSLAFLCLILLVKEYHQLCWWFQKALAMPRINYPSVARNNY